MSASFTKLRNGDFGVRLLDEPTAAGATVTVKKKNGETSTVRITRIIWQGADRDTGRPVALATFAWMTPRTESTGRRVCAECGQGGRLVPDMEDGLMKHYRCCDMPSENLPERD